MSNLKNQGTHGGHTIKLKINGMEVGRIQSIEATRNFGTEPQYEIGSIMPQEHVALRYEGSIACDKYMMRKKTLADLGLSSLAEGVLNIGVIDIEITDRYLGTIVRVYRGCTIQNQTENFRANQIAGENATWLYLSCDNGTPETVDTDAASS